MPIVNRWHKVYHNSQARGLPRIIRGVYEGEGCVQPSPSYTPLIILLISGTLAQALNGSEEAVRLLVGARGEEELIGRASSPPVTEFQSPQAIYHNGMAVAGA